MKRKLVLTKKFPFVEFKKIEERSKTWTDDISHNEIENAPEEQWRAIKLYRMLVVLNEMKKKLDFVSDFKFKEKSFLGDEERDRGAIKLRFYEYNASPKHYEFTFCLEEYDEKVEVQKVLIKAYQKKIEKQEKEIAELKQEITND